MELDSRYYYGLGVEELERNNIDKALEYFHKSLELEPHFKTFEKIYQCYTKINFQKEAGEYIEKAFYMNSRNDKIAIEYIKFLISQGRVQLAEQLLNDIIERNHSYGPANKLLKLISKENVNKLCS